MTSCAFVTYLLDPEVLPITGPLMAFGVADLWGAKSLTQRGGRQIGESMIEESVHWENCYELFSDRTFAQIEVVGIC